MIDFEALFAFEETVEKSDAAVRAMQAVQASARKKQHQAFLLRVLSAALETEAEDELDRLNDAADDIGSLAVGANDVEFEAVDAEVLRAEELED